MIRIQRAPEPGGLKTARANRFPKAHSDYASSTDSIVRAELLDGYASKATKKVLYKQQHGHCAWCEEPIRLSGSHIEHYRPKKGAWLNARRAPPDYDERRYWWLAWTWENLLLSCGTCNNPTYKGNCFPLEPGTLPLPLPATSPLVTPLPQGIWDTSSEAPLLLDPSSPDPEDDPLEHIRWAPVDRKLPEALWQWTPMGLSQRGQRTIEVLNLVDFADTVTQHLRAHVRPRVRLVEVHLPGDITRARIEWADLARDLVAAKNARYRAATWNALEFWVPDAVRRTHGLAPLPRP